MAASPWVHRPSLNSGRRCLDQRLRLKTWRGIGPSNRGRSSQDGRLGDSGRGKRRRTHLVAVVPWSFGGPRFLANRAWNRAPFLPTAPHWQEELDSLTFRRQRSTGTSGGSGFFVATLAGIEELLRSTSSFKNGLRSLPASTSHFYAGSMAPISDE
jgi:hypothetical protein